MAPGSSPFLNPDPDFPYLPFSNLSNPSGFPWTWVFHLTMKEPCYSPSNLVLFGAEFCSFCLLVVSFTHGAPHLSPNIPGSGVWPVRTTLCQITKPVSAQGFYMWHPHCWPLLPLALSSLSFVAAVPSHTGSPFLLATPSPWPHILSSPQMWLPSKFLSLTLAFVKRR